MPARPVLTLVGEVVAVKHVGADAGVSYGYSYRTSAPTTLALVALGYADGVPRLASNRATVHVGSATSIRSSAASRWTSSSSTAATTCPSSAARPCCSAIPARGVPSAHDWATATERDPLDLTAGLGAGSRRRGARA